jgi:hypothetical protein
MADSVTDWMDDLTADSMADSERAVADVKQTKQGGGQHKPRE